MCDRLLQSGRAHPPQLPGRIRSGEGLQPDPGPAIAAGKQPLDPGQAQLEDAERSGAGHRGRLQGRRAHASGGQTAQAGLLHARAVGQDPEGGHGQDQPMPVDAGRVQAAGAVPLPAHALEGAEALFDPDAHPVGAERHVVGGFVREHDPGGFLAGDPEHNQGAGALAVAEGLPGRDRVLPFTGHEAPGRPPRSGGRLEGHVAVVAHVGMPALTADGGPQIRALQAPVAEHAHGHVRRHGRPQAVEQGAEVRHPGTGLATGPEAPGHGDGQTPVDDAHDQGHQRPALGRGVDGQRQLGALPPGQDPAQEGRETGPRVQLHPAGGGPVGPVMEPLPQVLARRVPAQTQAQQGSQHRVLATAAGHHRSPHPQGQPDHLGRTQMGQMPLDLVVQGIECRRKKHGTGACWVCGNTNSLPANHAFSASAICFSCPDLLYLPLSVVVPQAQVLLAFLETGLDRPTTASQVGQVGPGHLGRGIAEISLELVGTGMPAQEQPNRRTGQLLAGGEHAQDAELSLQGTVAALQQGQPLPGAFWLLGRHRAHLLGAGCTRCQAHPRRRSPVGGGGRYRGGRPFGPDPGAVRHLGTVTQTQLCDTIQEGGVLAVGLVTGDPAGRQAAAGHQRPQQVQGQLGLGLEGDGLRQAAALPTPLPVRLLGPGLGQVERPMHQTGSLAPGVGHKDPSLAVGLLAQLPAPLPGHTDRLASLLAEVAAIHNQDALFLAQSTTDLLPVAGPQGPVRPGTLTHELLQRAHRIAICTPQLQDHPFHRLARFIAEQALQVAAGTGHLLAALEQRRLEAEVGVQIGL